MKPPRGEIVEALEVALASIKKRGDEQPTLVCLHLPDGRGGDYVEARIMESIAPNVTAGAWLRERGIQLPQGHEGRLERYKLLRKYRIRWIKQMIELAKKDEL